MQEHVGPLMEKLAKVDAIQPEVAELRRLFAELDALAKKFYDNDDDTLMVDAMNAVSI